jgi:chaperonin GroES
MKIRPLHDRILLKRVEEEEKSKGGIIIPDSAKETPAEGVIVAVGPGKKDDQGKVIPMGVKVGDHVIFRKYAGDDIKLEGEEHIILSEEDIIGIIEG